MTPSDIHEACHEAMLECPQFHGYDDDTYVTGYGEFANIPKKGYAAVIRFWKEETSLFEAGYDAALPEEVRNMFDDIEAVIDQAVCSYFSKGKLS